MHPAKGKIDEKLFHIVHTWVKKDEDNLGTLNKVVTSFLGISKESNNIVRAP